MSKKQSVISIIKSSLGSPEHGVSHLLEGMTAIRIRSIRKAYSLTQVAFADLLGLKFETYASWEKGRRFPSSPGCVVLMIAEKYPDVFLKKRKDIVKKLNKLIITRMKIIWLVLFIFLSGCSPYIPLSNTASNLIHDIDYNNSHRDTFGLNIDSTSSNRTQIRKYRLDTELVKFDSNNNLILDKWGLSSTKQKYPEVEEDIHQALQKINYYKPLKLNKNCTIIGASYGMVGMDISPSLYIKLLRVDAYTSLSAIPLWFTFCTVEDNSTELRLYLPSMIKCVASYFNKNFKGTIRCKR